MPYCATKVPDAGEQDGLHDGVAVPATATAAAAAASTAALEVNSAAAGAQGATKGKAKAAAASKSGAVIEKVEMPLTDNPEEEVVVRIVCRGCGDTYRMSNRERKTSEALEQLQS